MRKMVSVVEFNNDSQKTSSSHQHKNPTTITHLLKRPPIDITFSDVSYSVSEGRKRGLKTILKGVNGEFMSGHLTAIMGPSGAGKSTLMDILALYRTKNLSGSVKINGQCRILGKFRKLSCYIMQDDRLLSYLSVNEAMVVAANLKLGKDMKMSAKKLLINEILEAIGLDESVNTKTLNLSGGQRKRLSIALELISNPPVMFLDEPTSGLDSSSCFHLISLLSALSRGRRTIVCTIHQPSARIFEMFDKRYILAESQCIYDGPVEELIPFLGSLYYECPAYHNPADYVMEIASGDYGEAVNSLVMAVDVWKLKDSKVVISTVGHQSLAKTKSSVCTISFLSSAEEIASKTSRKKGYPISECAQFRILFKRAFLTIVRDKQLTHLRLVSHIVVGALIGMIYYDVGNQATKVMSNAGCIFFTTLFTMFTAMMPTILTFPMEMAVFVREHLNYWYSLRAFYFAKTLADLPFQILFSSVYVLVVYYLTSQPFELRRASMFVSIFILTSLVAQSLGLLIGAGLSLETGVFLGPVSTIPTILFNFLRQLRYHSSLLTLAYIRLVREVCF